MLGNVSIVNILCPFSNVIGFENIQSFLINMFFYKTKKSGQTVSNSRTKRAFNLILKAFFIIFKGLSIVRNCLRPESEALKVDFRAG